MPETDAFHQLLLNDVLAEAQRLWGKRADVKVAYRVLCGNGLLVGSISLHIEVDGVAKYRDTCSATTLNASILQRALTLLRRTTDPQAPQLLR